MNPEQLRRAEEVFDALVDLSHDERAKQLDARCGGDIELRAFVERLLARDESAATTLLRTPVYGAAAHGSTGADLDHPQQIGRYRIVDLIGEGGMGVVYLAEQTEPLKRQVALKLIKLGMDTKEVIARFESERQALAMMNHPNVASVLDAGSTDQGRPYFVMEHVPGVRITEYCDQHRFDVRQRLHLFAQVCHAVQHAHQKGIIHRDIKPSNVLVTVDQEQPIPKVIDFGVAKATQKRLTEQTLLTEQGQIVGTPEYMSPEQADMTSLDIDTRTDIYSLGVLLYELLTGTLPFEPASFRGAAYGDIQRIIREKDPLTPSTRLGRLGADAIAVANSRRTDAPSLRRQLRGDLDWITMKAMDKDRAMRYATALEFADDIQRHLKNEPVRARPPAAGYRMKKFIRRNRGPLAAAAVVVLALIAGTIGTAIGLVQAVRARDEAQLQAQMTQSINDFLNDDLLAAVAPEQQGKDVRMRDVLDAASKAIEQKFDDAPLIEASVRTTLGSTYEKLGEFEKAEPHRVKALALRESALGPRHTGTLAAMNNLANLYRAQGRFEEAEPILVNVLELRRREFGEDNPDTLTSMNNLANVYVAVGRYDDAERLYIQALERRRRILGEEHMDTLVVMNNLAGVYDDLGKFDKAEPLYKKALEIRLKTLGEEHPHTLVSLNNMAVLYYNQGLLEKAKPLYTRTLELRRRILGEDHPLTVGTMENLALVQRRLGQTGDAESLLLQVLDHRRKQFGVVHPDTLNTMNNLAVLYQNEGRLDEAQRLYEETLEHRRALLGDKHVQTMMSVNNLGVVYWIRGRIDEAGPLFKEAYDNRIEVLGNQNPATHQAAINLAHFYEAKGQTDLLRSIAPDILAGYQAKVDRPNPSAKTLGDYAWELCTTVAEELRDPSLALEYANRAVALTGGKDPDKLDTLALAQHMTGDSEAAVETEKKAIALLREGPSDTRTTYEKSLATFLIGAGRFADAEPLLLGHYQKQRADKDASPSATRAAAESLRKLYEAWHEAEPGRGFDVKADRYRSDTVDG